MLSTVLNIIMFEDCRNQVKITKTSFYEIFNDFTKFFPFFFQWSMSRPLLGLVLLNEDYFESLRDQVSNFTKFFTKFHDFMKFFLVFQIIQSQPASKQSSMATWFRNLMDGVERNLLTKNRDK